MVSHHYDYISMYPEQGGNEPEYNQAAVSACQTSSSYTSRLTPGSHPSLGITSLAVPSLYSGTSE